MIHLLALFLPISLLAAQPKKIDLAPPSLKAKAPETISVKEATVVVGHKRYQRIEYKNDVFYLRIQSPGGEEGEQDLLKPQQSRSAPILKDGKHPIPGDEEPRECLMRNLPFDPDKARVVGEVKITEVTSVYLEALHNECEAFYAKNSDAFLGVKVKTSEKTDLRMGLEKTPAGGLGPKGSFNLKF